jgi:tRNA A37 threonylcarbamoyladenosine biosynthesis protein TsaE
LGVDELLEDGAVLFVEWGRKFPEIAGRAVLWVELEIVSDAGRRARLFPQGVRGAAIVAALGKRLSG